jgi:hypothetical protein
MGMRDEIAKAIVKGIKAFHSSPHDFDKFDLSKLGTGQGANSYGKGFYAAENPLVSGRGGEYWQEFTRHPSITKTERDAAEFLALHNFDRQKAAQQVRAQLERATGGHPLSAEQAEFEKVVRLLESDKPVGARTYELDIKAHPEQFLQWDKTLAEQPHIVEAVPGIADAVRNEAHSRALSATSKPRADELWSLVKDPMQAPANFGVQRLQRDVGGEAMDVLRQGGIPGVRYADQGTRQTLSDLESAQKAQTLMSSGGRKDWGAWGEEIERLKAQPQTYNYVINDPSIIDITKKYGIPGAAAMGGLAAQDQYGGQ